ncbi:MAG: cyclic nucleotide-binding domain-containing protein [Pseudobdellovibrionaceae bacterium]
MSTKTFKRGEVIFKEGDKILALHVIQSGGVSLNMTRGKKTLDLFQLGSSQILGESVLLGQGVYSTSATATAETQLVEIPVEQMKTLYDSASQTIKLLLKSMGERIRLSTLEIKSNKMEKDTTPCPDEMVAPFFAAMYFTLSQKGEFQKENTATLSWSVLKTYSQRLFSLSPRKAEELALILAKLGYAKIEKAPPPDRPDAPPENQSIEVSNLKTLEGFFEYYQYFYYKYGKSDFLKVDDFCLELLEILLEISKEKKMDRLGVVSVDFHIFTEKCKERMSITFNSDHFARLEQKGVFIKRISRSAGVHLDYEIKEIQSFYDNWKFLKEIDKWNDKGFVDIKDIDLKWSEKNKPAALKTLDGHISCPSCLSPVIASAKFCPECGSKMQAKSAA